MLLTKLSSDYYNLGLTLASMNNLTFAINALRKASLLDSRNYQSLDALGLCLYKRGDFAEAKGLWLKSNSIYSGNISLAEKYLSSYEQPSFNKMLDIFNLALKDASLGKYNNSIKALTDKNFPCFEYSKFANLLGLCYISRGEANNARVAFRKALQIDSENRLTLNYLKADWGTLDKAIINFNVAFFVKKIFIRRS